MATVRERITAEMAAKGQTLEDLDPIRKLAVELALYAQEHGYSIAEYVLSLGYVLGKRAGDCEAAAKLTVTALLKTMPPEQALEAVANMVHLTDKPDA